MKNTISLSKLGFLTFIVAVSLAGEYVYPGGYTINGTNCYNPLRCVRDVCEGVVVMYEQIGDGSKDCTDNTVFTSYTFNLVIVCVYALFSGFLCCILDRSRVVVYSILSEVIVFIGYIGVFTIIFLDFVQNEHVFGVIDTIGLCLFGVWIVTYSTLVVIGYWDNDATKATASMFLRLSLTFGIVYVFLLWSISTAPVSGHYFLDGGYGGVCDNVVDCAKALCKSSLNRNIHNATIEFHWLHTMCDPQYSVVDWKFIVLTVVSITTTLAAIALPKYCIGFCSISTVVLAIIILNFIEGSGVVVYFLLVGVVVAETTISLVLYQ